MTFVTASIGSNIMSGLQNMIVGLLVVFVVLVFLSLVISCFKFVNKLEKPKEQPAAKKPAAPAPAAAPVPAPVPVGPGTMAASSVTFTDEVESSVAAVILAAVAETCGGNFTVKSIKKSK